MEKQTFSSVFKKEFKKHGGDTSKLSELFKALIWLGLAVIFASVFYHLATLK